MSTASSETVPSPLAFILYVSSHSLCLHRLFGNLLQVTYYLYEPIQRHLLGLARLRNLRRTILSTESAGRGIPTAVVSWFALPATACQ